jgi:hypothetical protein
VATAARHALDVLGGYIEKVRSDSDFASGEHEPSTLNAFRDGVRVPGGIFLDSAVGDLRLRGIRRQTGSYTPSPGIFDALLAQKRAGRGGRQQVSACGPESVPRPWPGEHWG